LRGSSLVLLLRRGEGEDGGEGEEEEGSMTLNAWEERRRSQMKLTFRTVKGQEKKRRMCMERGSEIKYEYILFYDECVREDD
jgi:hypothetical protein